MTTARFNLAIEMLFISGSAFTRGRHGWYFLFQSRNRDAFHFRVGNAGARRHRFPQFQSRNRDAFHFRLNETALDTLKTYVSISQSRCFSFQAQADAGVKVLVVGFNLAIEMLFISGWTACAQVRLAHVSISQSRCFSFQGRACGAPDTPWPNARTSASVHFQHDGAC